MQTWKSFGWPLALLGLSLASGCGVHTRLAVKNSGEAPIDVQVSQGEQSASFSAVAPGTTTDFKELDWKSYDAVKVSTGGQQSTVNLVPKQDNTVDVAADGSSTVQSVYNEKNEYW